MTVLEVDGVSIIPVHASFTAISRGVVNTPQTLARRLITAQWVSQVNVATALTPLTPTSYLQWAAPVPDLTATINDSQLVS